MHTSAVGFGNGADFGGVSPFNKGAVLRSKMGRQLQPPRLLGFCSASLLSAARSYHGSISNYACSPDNIWLDPNKRDVSVEVVGGAQNSCFRVPANT